MKIGIVGTGRVGSSIAHTLLFHERVTDIWLCDTDSRRMEGEAADLVHAAAVLGSHVKVREVSHALMKKCGLVFVCAGAARPDSRMDMTDLYQENLPVMMQVAASCPQKRTYVVTNPDTIFADKFGFRALGPVLDEARRKSARKVGGSWILDRKGYTNWGIAAAAFKVVSEWEE